MKELDISEKEKIDTVTFRMPNSLHKEIKKIAHREGRSMQEIVNSLSKDYAKTHGSGNPVYKLDDWKDPNFKLCPAFLADNNIWKEYIQKCSTTELTQLEEKAQLIIFFSNKKSRYGDVNVQTF